MDNVLTRQIGPLPVWAYGAVGGGVILLVLARRGVPSAQAAVDPNTPFPPAPGTDNSQWVPPTVLGPGQVGVGPGGTTSGMTVKDFLGGTSLSDFLDRLGPNYTQFQLHAGDTGVDISHSAQNVIDQQNYAIATSAGLAERGQELAAMLQQHTTDTNAALEGWRQYYTYLLALYGGGSQPVSGGGITYGH